MPKFLASIEKALGTHVGDRGFPLALACALVAILTPTLSLAKTVLGGHVHHIGWLILTPIFAVLAKLFAGIDWIVARRYQRVLLVSAVLIAASLETLYLGHLLGIHLGI